MCPGPIRTPRMSVARGMTPISGRREDWPRTRETFSSGYVINGSTRVKSYSGHGTQLGRGAGMRKRHCVPAPARPLHDQGARAGGRGGGPDGPEVLGVGGGDRDERGPAAIPEERRRVRRRRQPRDHLPVRAVPVCGERLPAVPVPAEPTAHTSRADTAATPAKKLVPMVGPGMRRQRGRQVPTARRVAASGDGRPLRAR